MNVADVTSKLPRMNITRLVVQSGSFWVVRFQVLFFPPLKLSTLFEFLHNDYVISLKMENEWFLKIKCKHLKGI